MNHLQRSSLGFSLRHTALAACLALGALAAPGAWAQAAAAAPAAAASAPTVRPEVGKLLQAARDAMGTGNFKESLARIAEVQAMPSLEPYEQYVVERMRASAALGNKDMPLALKSLEAAAQSPFTPAADRPLLIETAIKVAVQVDKFDVAKRWLTTYLAGANPKPEFRRLYPQVLQQLGDHAGVIAEVSPIVAADVAAKRVTPEATLRMLAFSQNEIKDKAGYTRTLELLVGSTGKVDYWADLLARVHNRDGFADERLRLDMYRLRRAVGVDLDAGELGDMAYRASQAGLPAEAQALLDEGFANGTLGKDANATNDKKLRDQVTKVALQDRNTLADNEAAATKAKEGNVALNLGMALSGMGLHDRALAMIALGQSKGGLRRPDDALLHVGVAQFRAGRIDDAKRSFEAVKGDDGTADLARLWLLHLNGPARK
jgi:hypothetical protein